MDAILITTEHDCVFFGYVEDADAVKGDRQITVKKGRCCVYWSSDVKGFLGLASRGPSEKSKVTDAVEELTAYDVTNVVAVSDEAQERWEAAPWG